MSKKAGSATPEGTQDPNKIAESATLEGTQEDAQEQTPGTTDTLFPEHVPAEEGEAEPSAEGEAQTEDSSSTEEVADETLKAEETEQMVKTVVDGVEKEVPLSEVLKGYQTGRHLFNEGQKIGEERKSLEQLKTEIVTATKTTGTQEPQEDALEDEYLDPATKALKQEIADLKSIVQKQGESIDSTKQVTAPIAYQNSLKGLDASMKGKGYEDFMEFVPQIEDGIAALSVEKQGTAWSEDYFSQAYLELKLKSLQTQQTAQKTTVAENADGRIEPNVVPIESANSSGSRVDDSDAAYTKAVETAKRTGDWTQVFKMKKIAGF
jgi:hypothetical protein